MSETNLTPAKKVCCTIFMGFLFDHTPTLGEVIKTAGWGSNRIIRESGFRIDTDFNWEVSPFFSRLIKEMPRITDPKTIIKHHTAVITPKGDNVIIVLEE